MRYVLAAAVAIVLGVAGGMPAQERVVRSSESDARDALLAALGTATLECLGTVGPGSYATASGALARTFEACVPGRERALRQIDSLLGLQFSEQGRADGVAAHYVARWDAFAERFPLDRIQVCPTWTLQDVLNAPTRDSVRRAIERETILKEGYRYTVASSQCPDGRCAVAHAIACAGGFGDDFIVEADPTRARIEVDPVSWLTSFTYSDACNPFYEDGYVHGFCNAMGYKPGARFAALERAGERCCFWDEQTQTLNTFGKYYPIDCGGYYCASYCM